MSRLNSTGAAAAKFATEEATISAATRRSAEKFEEVRMKAFKLTVSKGQMLVMIKASEGLRRPRKRDTSGMPGKGTSRATDRHGAF
jgi:hypothetical protein